MQQLTVSAILPLPMARTAADDVLAAEPDGPVLEEWYADLVVGYAAGPPYGERYVTDTDLAALEMRPRSLRRAAADNLAERLDQVEVHGLPPVFTLTFGGVESALLTCDDVWESLESQVDGEIVVGVPTRDVMFVTGSKSEAGLAKVERACERIYFAGAENPVSRPLLVRRAGVWYPF